MMACQLATCARWLASTHSCCRKVSLFLLAIHAVAPPISSACFELIACSIFSDLLTAASCLVLIVAPVWH